MRANERTRDRHDLAIYIFILLMGIIFMLFAGDRALQLKRAWEDDANMGSLLDPNGVYPSELGAGMIEPVLSGILTPPDWLDTFLTPQTGVTIVPISTRKPGDTRTPVPTGTSTLPRQKTPTLTAVPPKTRTSVPFRTNTVVFIPWTATNTPRKTRVPRTQTTTPTATRKPRRTVTPTGTATGTPTPWVAIPDTSTPTETPTVTETSTVTETPTVTLTPTATPYYPNINVGPGDGVWDTLPDGGEVIIDLGTPITVSGNPDRGYDLVYYERQFDATTIVMDWVVLDLFNSTDGKWYTIFYWGNFVPDLNSNISAYTENDNEPIPLSALYGHPGFPQTGILIDVDAIGLPAGDYQLLRIYVPVGGAGDGVSVDAVEVLLAKVPY